MHQDASTEGTKAAVKNRLTKLSGHVQWGTSTPYILFACGEE
jgi:hypothetical protein